MVVKVNNDTWAARGISTTIEQLPVVFKTTLLVVRVHVGEAILKNVELYSVALLCKKRRMCWAL